MSRIGQIASMEWFTYELKKKIIAVGCIVAVLCSMIGIAGIYVAAEVTPRPADGAKQIDAGLFPYIAIIGAAVLLLLIGWYHAISKRRTMQEAEFKPWSPQDNWRGQFR